MKLPAFRPLRSSKQNWTIRSVVLGLAWLLAWAGAKLLIVAAPLDHADAIVVLSGSAVIRERAELAARLFQEGRAPKIILTNDNQQSSWSRSQQRNPYYYERAIAS